MGRLEPLIALARTAGIGAIETSSFGRSNAYSWPLTGPCRRDYRGGELCSQRGRGGFWSLPARSWPDPQQSPLCFADVLRFRGRSRKRASYLNPEPDAPVPSLRHACCLQSEGLI